MSFEDAVLGAVAAGPPPGFSWLDSGPGRRGLVGIRPALELRGDTLDVVDRLEQERQRTPSATWIGWLSYEFGAATHGAKRRTDGESAACLRRFDGIVEIRDGREHLRGSDAAARATLEELRRAEPLRDPTWPLEPLSAMLDPEVHRARIRRALGHIGVGDSYQVNVAQPFRARWRSDAGPLCASVAHAYGVLRHRTPAPMGGLLENAGRFILSNSPETLLAWRGDALESSPIKGTRPRGRDASEDAALSQELLFSHKDAAEHVMIVDLVRNDLGRVARVGTVDAKPLRLVSLPTVHHLVTDVSARLRPDASMREVFSALLPAGSITGAPKRRTVELIESIEDVPRGIYCGALVLVEPTGCTLSVAIRTGVADHDGLEVFGGGGIVLDSDPEAERLETVAKVRAFDPDAGGPGRL